MNYDLICTWLGLPAGCWPPDHYRLLGLEPSVDAERIEAEVQHRLEIIRRYQLNNPEQATEAMNRLAQAFVCLTDPEARRGYDAQLRGGKAAPPPDPEVAPVSDGRDSAAEVAEPGTDVLDVVQPRAPARGKKGWETTAPTRPPARADLPALPPEPVPEPAPLRAASGNGAAPATPATPLLPDIPLLPSPAARLSSSTIRKLPAAARRGWGTRRALYQRLARTRQLRRAWDVAGKYLGRPALRVTNPAETSELTRQLVAVRELLEIWPLVGDAGQPGYLVAALARQRTIGSTLQNFLPTQREALARDWQAAQKLLAEQQASVRAQLRKSRRPHGWPRSLRVAGAFLRDHPTLWLVALALLALFLASRGSEGRRATEPGLPAPGPTTTP